MDVLSPVPVEFVSDDPIDDVVAVVGVVWELRDGETWLVDELWLGGEFVVVGVGR